MTASGSGSTALEEPRTLVSNCCGMNLQPERGGGVPSASRPRFSALPREERGLKLSQFPHSQVETLSQLFLSRETDYCLFPSSSTPFNVSNYYCYIDNAYYYLLSIYHVQNPKSDP